MQVVKYERQITYDGITLTYTIDHDAEIIQFSKRGKDHGTYSFEDARRYAATSEPYPWHEIVAAIESGDIIIVDTN